MCLLLPTVASFKITSNYTGWHSCFSDMYWGDNTCASDVEQHYVMIAYGLLVCSPGFCSRVNEDDVLCRNISVFWILVLTELTTGRMSSHPGLYTSSTVLYKSYFTNLKLILLQSHICFFSCYSEHTEHKYTWQSPVAATAGFIFTQYRE